MPPPSPDRLLAFAAMRDEGAFVVEWASWYRMLGFDLMVAINDCTDHSPQLLRRLEAAGWLRLVEHRPRPGQPPKQSAYRAVRGHPALAAAGWLWTCDVDELLVVRAGDGSVGALLDAVGRDVLGVAVHWQCFGNGGHATYEDGLVHRQFLRRGAGVRPPNAFFKTLAREPARWARLADHAPLGWEGPEAVGGLRGIVDGEGRPIAKFAGEAAGRPVRFTAEGEITHRNAQVSHYVIRSDEGYDLKRGTPSASALKDRYTEEFRRRRNRNEVEDRSALLYRDRFDPVHAEALAIPGVRRLHHLCCADYVARLCAARGARAQDDPRWHWHLAEAGGGGG